MRLLNMILIASFTATMSVACCSQTVVGEMFASDASVHGSVLFASGGTQIQSGSSVTSGGAVAVLRLRRGGEVRVCPKTSVSVAASPNGRDLLWGMNSGAIEAHYTLSASSDTVMTPDFRILLSGPGIFHFAISSDSGGNMCVRSLPENTASLIVAELNGDGTYQVKPNVQIMFRNGQVTDPSPLVPPDCGCPPPALPVQTAEEKKPEREAKPSSQAVATAAPAIPSMPQGLDLPLNPVPAEMAHLEMEAPFVYEAGDPDMELDHVAARLRLTSGTELPKAAVQPPPVPKMESKPAATVQRNSKEKKGFFGKIGDFFSHVFK